jgi:sulfite exporter TauE/SafE
METLTANLLVTAATVALVHVLAGPDHIVPFVALARARHWSASKTAWITFWCGVGHVLSSLLLGGLGLALGAGLAHLTAFEEVRGGVAAWALVAFGLAYALWGTRRALVHRHQLTLHAHGHGVHIHAGGATPHQHQGENTSVLTFWSLFLIFAFGPCEPLIPLFMLPASRGLWDVAWATGAVFGAVTLATMVTVVLVVRAGTLRLPLGSLERWSHALAGSVIALSGLAVIFLGL